MALPIIEVEYTRESTYFILLHPVVKSRCFHASCNFSSNALIGTRSANSFQQHLFKKHNIKATRKWRCSSCQGVYDGHCIRFHECGADIRSTNSSSSGHNTNDSFNSHSPTTTLSLSRSLSQLPNPISQNTSLNSTFLNRLSESSISVASHRSPAPNLTCSTYRNSTPLFSIQTSPNSHSSILSEPNRTLSQLPAKWEQILVNCNTIIDLDQIITDISHDMFIEGEQLLKPNMQISSNHPTHIQQQTPSMVSPSRRTRGSSRNQSRQQRRGKTFKKYSNKEACNAQALFRRFPRRAVRKILGDINLKYDGNTVDLMNHANKTHQDVSAHNPYSDMHWNDISEAEMDMLSAPPSRKEILEKLKRSRNTAPGKDKLEFVHIKLVDKKALLLSFIFKAVHRLGIPASWKTSKTILIHKKGPTDIPSNFRPICLLSTMYKLYSGILSKKIINIATSNNWISKQQKGFLPGIKGIQEHTFTLETAILEAKKHRANLYLVWLDLTNAFGSIPHSILFNLFDSLPIPDKLNWILKDIYSDSATDYKDFTSRSNCGVKQGDSLSPIIFNLASEPLIRAAIMSRGVDILGTNVSVTTYADDSALLSNSPEEMENLLIKLSSVSKEIGLHFNPSKCSSLSFIKGKHVHTEFKLDGKAILPISAEEAVRYLGIPIGNRFLFRTSSELPKLMDKIADSALAPWQKLEVLRSHLLPSLSHDLSSGRVEKGSLFNIERRVKHFIRLITNTPDTSATPFFYANRALGGMGIGNISEEADIWTIAKGTQLLNSSDPAIQKMAFNQLSETIASAAGIDNEIPISEFLSGSQANGLYAYRYNSKGANLWTRTRHSSRHLKTRIDVSDMENIKIQIDDICAVPQKVVRSIRLALRNRWSDRLRSYPKQGAVARSFHSNQAEHAITQLISQSSTLSFRAWNFWHKARLQVLPVKSFTGSPDIMCRKCFSEVETSMHVLSCCRSQFLLMTKRHNDVQDQLCSLLSDLNISFDKQHISSSGLKPDLVITSNDVIYVIDIAIPFDNSDNVSESAQRKISKYSELGLVIPFVVGTLGSWPVANDILKEELGISARLWKKLKNACIKAAIEGSGELLSDFFGRS